MNKAVPTNTRLIQKPPAKRLQTAFLFYLVIISSSVEQADSPTAPDREGGTSFPVTEYLMFQTIPGRIEGKVFPGILSFRFQETVFRSGRRFIIDASAHGGIALRETRARTFSLPLYAI